MIVAMDVKLLVVMIINLVNQCRIIEIEKQFTHLLRKKKKMLEEVHYCKEIMKNTFQKGTHHVKKIEVDFQTADRCHKCDKLYGGKHIQVKDKVLLIKNVILSLG